MRVLIFGASKGIGLETTRQALVAGHDVRLWRDQRCNCDLKF